MCRINDQSLNCDIKCNRKFSFLYKLSVFASKFMYTNWWCYKSFKRIISFLLSNIIWNKSHYHYDRNMKCWIWMKNMNGFICLYCLDSYWVLHLINRNKSLMLLMEMQFSYTCHCIRNISIYSNVVASILLVFKLQTVYKRYIGVIL